MIVPLHREIARGTLGSILRQAGLSTREPVEFLDRPAARLPVLVDLERPGDAVDVAGVRRGSYRFWSVWS